MSTVTVKDFEIIQKIGADEFVKIHPETKATNVLLEVEGIEAANVGSAISEINENIKAITGGGVVTGIKGEAESEYRLGQVNITKQNIGLGNVDNTADANKNVAYAVKASQDADGKVIADTYAKKTELPTKVSDLTNDSGFITNLTSGLANYYKKTETYTQSEIDAKLTAIPKFAIEVVEALPVANISSATVYLLKTGDESSNLYTEYIYANNAWECLGTQTVDLSNYATKAYAEGLVATLDGELSDVAKSGNYSDLNGIPSIPSKISDLTDDTATTAIARANKLANARTIAISGGATGTATSFDGSENISIAVTSLDATKLSGTAIINTTGNAATATKLSASKTFQLTGGVTGSVSSDLSGNVSIATTLANSGVVAGSYSALTVNSQGLVVGGGQLIEVGTAPSANLAVGGILFKEIV